MRVLGAVAVSVLAVAGMAGAEPPPGKPFEGAGPVWGGERMARVLQLSDEQQQKARQAFEARQPQMQAFFGTMRESWQRLQAAAQSENPDPAQVGELFLEHERLRTQGRAQREEMMAAFRALLTPEQQGKLDLLETARAVGESGPEGGPPGGLLGLPMPR